jgi:glycosyltransferase involved in cell wall biosynthesis
LVHGHPVRELARIIESEGAHILHTNNQVNRDLYAVIAAKRAGVPCVAHLRSFFSLGFNKTKARFVNEHVARFVAYSPAVAEHWTALGLDSRKIEVLPNAIGEVPADPLDLHAEYGIPREKKLVGIVGKVIPVRGHDFLFRALRVLGRHDVVLLVVGGGEEREIRRAKSRTVELGIGERVLFTGHSARAKDVIAALDALVMPYGIEPFGRVLLEAWKLGTPVVMSALGGIRDLADHGENALLVSYGDEKALAEAMARILDDESLAERLSANGRKHVQKRFSVAAYANRMQEIYESVLSEAEHGQAS